MPRAHLASNGREVVFRCPFCGDSQKDLRDAHFYVGLQTQYDTDTYQSPPKYHCFLCERGGILTGETLLEIVNYDIEAEELVYELNILANNYRKTSKNTNKYFIKQNYTTIGCVENTILDNTKLEYLNNRLGLSLTINQALKDKVVFDIQYFLYYNGVNKFNLSIEEMHALSENFIGFLSLDNSFITMRNFTGKQLKYPALKKRYIKYPIINEENDIMLTRYYCAPSIVNTLSIEPINIHVAEGPFDILSILYNLRGNNREDNIYIAAGGKAYFNAVYTIINKMKLSPNIVIHVYPDNNVNNDQVKFMSRKIASLDIPIYVHRNIKNGEQDFGVRKSRINENIFKI